MKRIFPVLGLMVVLALLGVSTAAAQCEVADEDLRYLLKVELDKRIETLLDHKTPGGFQDRHGSYGRKFCKVDDTTYTVTFTERTATATQLKADRYTLTLKQTGPRKWEIADEKLEHSFDGLYRYYPAPKSYAFEAMNFDREGMKITGGNGQLYFTVFGGEINGFVVVADNMKYDYSVPEDVTPRYFKEVEEVMHTRFKAQMDFDPAWVEFECDPRTCPQVLDTVFTGLPDYTVPVIDDSAPWVPHGTAAGISGLLAKRYERFGQDYLGKEDYKKRLHDNPFTNFEVRPKEDREMLEVALFSNEANFLYFRIDSYEAEEVALYGLFQNVYQGVLLNYHGKKTRDAGIDPYELENRPDSDAREYEIESAHVEVDLALEDPEVLVARATFRMNVKRDMTELNYGLITQTRGTDMEERRNPALRMYYIALNGEEQTVIPTSPFQGVVPFPEPVPAGSTIEVTAEYSNRSIRKFTPSYSNLPRQGWLPFVRFTDQIADYQMTVRTPSEYKTLGVGELLETSTADGVTTTHWRADQPVSFPTVIFGKYFEGKPNEEIHVIKKDGHEVPVTVHVDEVSKMNWDIRGKKMTAVANQAASALDFYRSMSDYDYPYRTLNLVNDAGSFAGQAPASIVYLGGGVFRGEGIVGMIGGSDLSMFNKTVVAHEIGHQWWGSLIGNVNNRNYWYSETLAEYFSALWIETVYGDKEGPELYQKKVEEWRKSVLDTELMASVKRSASDYMGEFPGPARQALIYNKGPLAFHMLRTIFGDKKFAAFIAPFVKDLAEKQQIVTLDIQRAAEKHLGGVDAEGNPYNVDLGWFFDQWILDIGIPEYSLNYTTRQNEDGKWLIEGVVKQRVVYGNRINKYEMPGVMYRAVVPITVLGKKDQKWSKKLVVESAETPFRLLVPQRPLEVVLNEGHATLAHDVVVNQDF
ncbi:MAG: hypothetical protein IFK94_11285 [Acidobacteria bacterium]|uniref:Peptidase M1 membrane alanine aminopeptidase domain-containing protein n=1 Tax=Candidatus Polarisedimenticola svalbardensis TaxID=2886004 RepID=A0A8J7CLX4_9BACT|nr:hypothetical protein [Candidatus Polarisedimenticola svalbardensis]